MNEQEVIYSIALSHLPHIGLVNAHRLYEEVGSATLLFEHRTHLPDLIPEVNKSVVEAFLQADEHIQKAEKELNFILQKNIKAFTMNDPQYPQRLLDCNDAPVVLFFCGETNLNAPYVINIIGTRRCTQYGKDICRSFVADLHQQCPDILIASGLAYGIDIHAHRAALQHSLPTVGVLAHGLDRIYPALHRSTAVSMTHHGGLLTEYISGTTPERQNFIQRNRIVAGMADATIVVESASHGGALITAQLASSYNRDVFAFPGRVFDEMSQGCNRLISSQQATAIQSADDLLQAMGWKQAAGQHEKHREPELFPQLTEDERKVVDTLRSVDNLQVNQIVVQTGLPFHTVSSLLYDLECRGIVMLMGGARYKLL